MPSGTAQRAKQVIKDSLPDLNFGIHKTKSHALHPETFIGPLVPWDNFEKEARQNLVALNLGNGGPVLGFRSSKQPTLLSEEQFVVGDEMAIQARFTERLSQAMTAILTATGSRTRFGDYKSSSDQCIKGKVPDVAIMDHNNLLRIVGELKTPWIDHHDLEAAHRDHIRLRRLFGQIVGYMVTAKLKYGFISTYCMTIFLKQEVIGGVWTIAFSRPIMSCTEWKNVEDGNYEDTVSLRECFLYLVRMAENDHIANNQVPEEQWFEC
ncbi:hypothetical protein BDV25DRAFT_145895 [Aspergillus avenaceus]|uniref:Fungal-type protein kinase domain-containing protein n=1 Tax=Aspergillus avenaceus TaxID=36643 RepID=A0A5N6TCT9_ASPAV|nr:hypothetical protein BDV25DRAFT_145895 [Aspergillus avenaceus]